MTCPNLVKRNAKCLIFVLDNGICLCPSCHTAFIHSTLPDGPRLARAWTEEKYATRLARLEIMKRELAYDRNWQAMFNGLWSALGESEADFRGYLGSHPAIARLWAGQN